MATKQCFKSAALCALTLGCGSASAIPFSISITTDFTGTTLSLVEQTQYQNALDQAAGDWESLITGYQATNLPFGFSSLNILAYAPYIDGAGKILGASNFTHAFATDGFLYASKSFIRLDSADVSNMINGGSLLDVVLHEMAHSIGFGLLWNGPALGYPGTQQIYVNGSGQYTGRNALAEWRTEFSNQQNANFIPVELGGGAGTANYHWNEIDGGGADTGITQIETGRDLRYELMSGWMNTPSYVSQTSVCSFKDIGYTISGSCPEPEALTLLALGLGCLGITRRRRA